MTQELPEEELTTEQDQKSGVETEHIVQTEKAPFDMETAISRADKLGLFDTHGNVPLTQEQKSSAISGMLLLAAWLGGGNMYTQILSPETKVEIDTQVSPSGSESQTEGAKNVTKPATGTQAWQLLNKNVIIDLNRILGEGDQTGSVVVFENLLKAAQQKGVNASAIVGSGAQSPEAASA